MPPYNSDEYNEDRLERIARSIGRIEGKLDQWGDLPARIDKLERWRSWLSGAWAVVAAAFVWLWQTKTK